MEQSLQERLRKFVADTVGLEEEVVTDESRLCELARDSYEMWYVLGLLRTNFQLQFAADVNPVMLTMSDIYSTPQGLHHEA